MNHNWNFKKKLIKRLQCTLMGAAALTMAVTSVYVPFQVKAEEERIVPHKAAYGYYVDVYKNNEKINMTPETNPSIGVLSKFLDIYTPGEEWNNGTVKNESVHKENLKMTANIAGRRTQEQKEAAYLDDRRNQSYSMISGLGIYADEFMKGTNAGTTISDQIPEDATTVLYNDEGNSNGNWADTDTTYGSMVQLVNTIRNSGTSTSQAKAYYKYMRPFRWTDDVEIADILAPAKKSDPSNDGGFPSGHTNAAYLTAYGLAYAMPERYQELITRASELGNNRIVAGMHSCLDVIGGRVMATAVAASALNDKDNIKVKEEAYEAARELLKTSPSSKDDYADYETNKKKNLERLTYGLSQTGDTTKAMVVPKGAEVLLETRLPYLDASQRRDVLYTTGLESGYPVLDDAEGWGRLNLFEAANGYGSFLTDVTVNMDAKKGGFDAFDQWKNDIDGTGSLTKEGTGVLALSGKNSYIGGTIVNGGTIDVANTSALGNGDVTNNSNVEENVTGEVLVKGDYAQDDDATLTLNLDGINDVFTIEGEASLDGTLVVNVKDGLKLSDQVKLISYQSRKANSTYETVTIHGASQDAKIQVIYKEDGVYLVKGNAEVEKDLSSFL